MQCLECVDPLNLHWESFRRDVVHYTTRNAQSSASKGRFAALRGVQATCVLARGALLLALNRVAAQALPFIPLGSPGLSPPPQILPGVFADELSASPLAASAYLSVCT